MVAQFTLKTFGEGIVINAINISQSRTDFFDRGLGFDGFNRRRHRSFIRFHDFSKSSTFYNSVYI